MTTKIKILVGVAIVVALVWFLKRRGTVNTGIATVSSKGANVDTSGCPEGFRLRPGKGMAKPLCVSRFGDDTRTFEPTPVAQRGLA